MVNTMRPIIAVTALGLALASRPAYQEGPRAQVRMRASGRGPLLLSTSEVSTHAQRAQG